MDVRLARRIAAILIVHSLLSAHAALAQGVRHGRGPSSEACKDQCEVRRRNAIRWCSGPPCYQSAEDASDLCRARCIAPSDNGQAALLPTCTAKCQKRYREKMVNCDNPTCEQTIIDERDGCFSECPRTPDDSEDARVHPKHTLAVRHHAQSQPVWCWAAAIAMVAEFLQKRETTDCEVASRFDRKLGGGGVCCEDTGGQMDDHCFHARKLLEVKEIMRASGLDPVEFHRALTWNELRHSIDAGFPIAIAIGYGADSGHMAVIDGYQEPSTVFIDDPAVAGARHASRRSFSELVTYVRPGRFGPERWIATWYFLRDEWSGYLNPDNKNPSGELVISKSGEPGDGGTVSSPDSGPDGNEQR